MPAIQISDEVYRRLQALAIPFEDKEPEDVIRRLLDLAPADKPSTAGLVVDVGADLVSHVGRLPHGARLRARYKGREFEAEIANGRVLWNSRSFDSLSSAAVATIQSTGTKRPTENGWRYWEVEDPDTGEWKPATEYQTR